MVDARLLNELFSVKLFWFGVPSPYGGMKCSRLCGVAEICYFSRPSAIFFSCLRASLSFILNFVFMHNVGRISNP